MTLVSCHCEGATHVDMLTTLDIFSCHCEVPEVRHHVRQYSCALPCHCEGAERPWQSQGCEAETCNSETETIAKSLELNEITTSCATPRNDIKIICHPEAIAEGSQEKIPQQVRDDKSHFPRPTGEGLRERGLSSHDEIMKRVQDDRVLSEAHGKELNVLTSYRLNDFKKKAGATHVDMSANIRRAAFTLAEVLITLGIIGIVAAMTIPTLISSYKKHAAETKLRYFYSMMTNAIKLSEVENGPIEQWTNVLDAEDFFNTYLKKYIKTAASNSVTEKCADCRSEYYVAFPNGTAMTIYDYDRAYMNFHISFLTESNPKNRFQDSSIAEGKKNGVNTFYFLIHTKGETDDTCPGTSLFLGKSGFDAYLWWKNYKWNTEKNCYEPVLPETQEEFKNELMSGEYGCATNGMYCTALIQLNGWKIPEDYPKKF